MSESGTIDEFIYSLERAERNVLAIVLEATRPVLATVGGGIGEAPSRFGAFSFRITAPDSNDYVNSAAFFDAHSLPSIASKAEVVGAFRSREEAQRFTMALLFGLPRKTMEAPAGEPTFVATNGGAFKTVTKESSIQIWYTRCEGTLLILL